MTNEEILKTIQTLSNTIDTLQKAGKLSEVGIISKKIISLIDKLKL